jgi:hypothetical protein
LTRWLAIAVVVLMGVWLGFLHVLQARADQERAELVAEDRYLRSRCDALAESMRHLGDGVQELQAGYREIADSLRLEVNHADQ